MNAHNELGGITLAVMVAACSPDGPPTPWLDALLDAGERFAPGHDVELPSRRSVEGHLEDLAASASKAMHTGESAHGAIVRAIFETRGIEREVDDDGPEHMFLATTLSHRRGSCLGLVQVAVVLGERLRVPLRPMAAPGHVFVAQIGDDSGAESIAYWEMLRRGEVMPASWYTERYAPPADVSAYMRALDATELVGLLAYNLGNEDRVRRKLGRASVRYGEAIERFPEFPEAHASAGLIHHLLGDLDAAGRAYGTARRLHPGLDGLADNVGLLAREQLWRWAAESPTP